jgi:hypothetical protein
VSPGEIKKKHVHITLVISSRIKSDRLTEDRISVIWQGKNTPLRSFHLKLNLRKKNAATPIHQQNLILRICKKCLPHVEPLQRTGIVLVVIQLMTRFIKRPPMSSQVLLTHLQCLGILELQIADPDLSTALRSSKID